MEWREAEGRGSSTSWRLSRARRFRAAPTRRPLQADEQEQLRLGWALFCLVQKNDLGGREGSVLLGPNALRQRAVLDREIN